MNSFIKNRYTFLLLIFIIVLAIVYSYRYYVDKDVIAYVGEYKIKKSEFEQVMKEKGGRHIHLIDKEKLLEELIEKRLLLNKAYQMEFDKDPQILRKIEELLRSQVKKEYIEKANKQIDVSAREINNYYDQNKEEFLIPSKSLFAILFYKKNKMESKVRKENIYAKLEEIRSLNNKNQLPNADKGFGKYAVKYSEHRASKYKGGIIGWFYNKSLSIWEEDVLRAGFKLKNEGEVSNIIETKKGYYLIRLVQREPKKYKSFKDVKDLVYHKLIIKKQKEIKKVFKESLKKEFGVSINKDTLDEIQIKQFEEKEKLPKIPSFSL